LGQMQPQQQGGMLELLQHAALLLRLHLPEGLLAVLLGLLAERLLLAHALLAERGRAGLLAELAEGAHLSGH
ncbi:hypothetical protein, partial [Streptomyces purpurogeneiscleroticus]|uniref:hypothetical protein n=1 Tax=Streptomyces purpurogeneiscleroticus TaxID=68259 RepID=UPI001CBB7708